LYGSLDGHREEEPSEAGPVPEELYIRLRFVLMLVGDGVLDLRELGDNPWIILISMRMKLSKDSEAIIRSAVVDEPTRRLREKENEESENAGWDDLDGKTDTPLLAARSRETNV
jgi:hypothetical protein